MGETILPSLIKRLTLSITGNMLKVSSLRWKKFGDYLNFSLEDSLMQSRYADVTIVSDDQIPFRAHKIILSFYSEVFREIFLENPHDHPLIYVRGISSEDLLTILEFMYLGKTEFDQDRILELFMAAEELQLKQLSKVLIEERVIKREKDVVKETKSDEHAIEHGGGDMNLNPSTDVDIDTMYPEVKVSFPTVKVKKIFACNKCNASFASRKDMKMHKKAEHDGFRYNCNSCEYKSADKVMLKNHSESVHEGIRYTCNECGYSATQKGHLRTHQKSVHEGIKYSCSECSHISTRKDNLNVHKKKKHSQH